MLGRRRKTPGSGVDGSTKRARWREEFGGAEDTTPLELSEEDLRRLQEEEEAQQQQEECDNSCPSQEMAVTVTRTKKRKRFEWMDSDDESVTASSSDEEQVEGNGKSGDQVENPPRDSGSDMSRSPSPEYNAIDSSKDGAVEDSTKTRNAPEAAGPEKGTDHQVNAESTEILFRQLDELDEAQQRTVRCLLLSNLPFEATLNQIVNWVEFRAGIKTLAVQAAPYSPPCQPQYLGANGSTVDSHCIPAPLMNKVQYGEAPVPPPPEPSRAGAAPPKDPGRVLPQVVGIVSATAASASATSPIGFQRREHSGRVFLELESTAVLRKAMTALHGLTLQGRRIGLACAYKMGGRFCPLVTRAQLRFFLKQNMGNQREQQSKFKPLDGGCVWLA